MGSDGIWIYLSNSFEFILFLVFMQFYCIN